MGAILAVSSSTQDGVGEDLENHDMMYREIVSQRDIDEKVNRDRGMKVEDNHIVNFDHDKSIYQSAL